jgi:hypothetical protein
MNYFDLLIRLGSVYDRNVGKTLTSKEIARKIKRVIPFKECVIIPNDTLSVRTNNLQVSGVYDPDLDEDSLPPIELEISFPKKQPKFTLDESDLTRTHWYNLVMDLVSVMGHEFVHLEQFRRRNFRFGRSYTSDSNNTTLAEAQEYYGIPDEVDAYAFTTAASMSHGLITKGQPTPVEQTATYLIYESVFDKRHPVVLKLKKKATVYYKRLEQQFYAKSYN